jgi:HEAT repeat protein
VRRAAIRWLGQIKDGDAVELLERQLRHTDEGVRAAAATALARIGKGDLVAFGTHAIADKARGVRLAGIELLVVAKAPAANDALGKLAEDPDPLIAAEAAIAVKRDDLVDKALDRALADADWTIRAGAINIAARAKGKSAAATLAHRLIADKEVGVRLAAARALASAGDKTAAAAVFAEALGSPLALSAASDLANLGDDRGIKALDAMVRDKLATPDARATAANAHRQAHRVTPGLVAALADPNGVVRVEAASTLVTLARH